MDISIFRFINGLAGKYWLFDYFGVFSAQYLGYFLIFITLILIFQEKKRKEKIHLAVLVLLSSILSRGIIAEILKFFVSRPRPFSALGIKPLTEYGGYDINMSFPSGHAAIYFALAVSIILFFRFSEDISKRKWGWRFLGAAFLIGVARIFIGFHWPSDILAGAIIGIISAVAIKKILDFEFNKKIVKEN